MYLASNHFAEAIPLYRRALRANPHNVAAQTGLAQAQRRAAETRMNLYISCDMEGTAGVCSWKQCDPSDAHEYPVFRRYMTREVRAAIEGAREARRAAKSSSTTRTGRCAICSSTSFPATTIFA